MLSWLPESVSSYGYKIDHVIEIIYYVVGAWFVAVQAILFTFLIKYRRSNGAKAVYVLGNNFKSFSWVAVPVIAVVGFDIGIDLAQGPVWDEIKIEKPADAKTTIRVTAQQFAWEFLYPGTDGAFDTADDIKSFSELYVPLDEKVIVQLEAKDVIHSFWVPNLRLKQDIVPGRRILAWFNARKPGDYELACAELCGFGHGNMRAMVHVLPRDQYEMKLAELAMQGDEGIY